MSAPASATSDATSHAAVTEVENGGRTVQQYLKDVGLFFAAPFITLAYLLLFPFLGVRLLLRSRRQR